MNTVCPGFVPHHVKPNRCRRCFKDIHDHDNEVTTSFTLPLPRRRRESVSITEAPKVTEEVAGVDQSASFTITETTSLGRRTRQRSSSTSSWFQEKKVDEIHKEKIDSLFKNADDSRASYKSTQADDATDTVAVVRIPSIRRRTDDETKTNSIAVEPKPQDSRSLLTRLSDVKQRNARSKENDVKDEFSSPPVLPPKTMENRFDLLKNTDSKVSEVKVMDTKPTWTRYGTDRTELSSKSTDSRFDPVKKSDADKKSSDRFSNSKYGVDKTDTLSTSADSRLDSVKKSDADKKLSDSRFSSSKYGVDKTDTLSASTDSRLDSVKQSDTDKKLSDRFSSSKYGVDKTDTLSTNSGSRLDSVKKSDTDKKLSDSRFSSSRYGADKNDISSTGTDSKIDPLKKSDTDKKSSDNRFSSSKYGTDKTEISLTSTDNKSDPVKKPDTDKKLSDNKFPSSKYGTDVSSKTIESKFDTVKKPESKIEEKESDKKLGDSKFPTSKYGTELSTRSYLKSKFEPETPKLEESKLTYKKPSDPKVDERKPLPSKFGEIKLKDTKFGEVKLRDSKISEIRARASKFESATVTEAPKSKEVAKTIDVKPAKPVETKPEPKPVLARFGNLRSGETKTPIVPKVEKPPPPPKKSSSEEESESESDESKSPPAKVPSKIQSSTTTVVDSAEKTKPKNEPPKAEDTKTQVSNFPELENSVELLKDRLRRSEEECSRLLREKAELQRQQQILLDRDREALEKTAAELSKMRAKLVEMQAAQDDARGENRKVKQELREAKAELSRKEAEWSKKEAELSRREAGPRLSAEQLKLKLAQSEALCEELAEENEEIKKEVRDLEQELEELHDNFREDQASEFRGLKKELETATKNCRVLQFKLRKAEKKCELLELDRHGLEDKVREYQAAVRQDVDRSKWKDLEKELGMSRNLAKDLTGEVAELKEALTRAEAENDALRQQGGGPPRSVTPVSPSLLSPMFRDGLQGKDYETVSHELFDTMERESDLREQLRFSEEEAKTARRKMSALEQENETLMLQIKKLTNIVKTRSGTKGKDEDAEEEEPSAENLKIQLDLLEQEMGVLRRKLDETEKENESLQSEVKYLQEKIINQPLIEVPADLPKDGSGPGAYWEHKVRLQEHEIRESRRRAMEQEREIERLHTEVEIYRKKASKMMVRSRSLDSDLQVDLKRQLQLVEQEANMLRQKVNSLEGENDKLGAENKRMTLRLSKKPPPSSADLLQMDNLELKQKLEEQQRKLDAMRQEIEKAKSDDPIAIIQDYKPRRESLTSLLSDNENDLIGSLKKKLRSRDEEQQALQSRAMQLEVENGRLSREYKKLKESLSSRKRPAKAVRDSATRIELRELVSELQDEISELQVSLRSREVVQEGLEEEIERINKELRETGKELKQKEEKLNVELLSGRSEKEALKKEVEAQRSRASSAEEQLSHATKLSGPNVEQAKRIAELSQEKRDAERRARAAEEALENKTQRLRDTQEKLNATASLKEDMARSNRILESQKADLEKEVEEHRSLLVKAEARATELRKQVDKTDRDLTSLRKECNQLRNELEDERTRLKQSADKRQTEVNVGWSREREGLRRTENELRNRIEHLQHSITESEKMWIEKESRLRDDFKKKKDNAVREAREKGEAAIELCKEEEKILRGKIQELTDKLEKVEASVKDATDKHRHLTAQHRRDKEDWQAEKDELESQVRSERKRREKLDRDSEQALKVKEEELLLGRERLVAMEREHRRMQMQVEEVDSLQQKVKILEKEGDRVRGECELITSKYDQLEDDFVKTKAGLVQDKEIAEANMMCLKRDNNELSFELTSLKGTYNARQDNWIKEKLDLQERLKELTRRLERLKTVEQERRRLQDALEEKDAVIESHKKDEKHLREEREKLSKRVEELTKMLGALPKSGPTARTGESGRYDELESTRRDYEGRMAMMTSEMSSMQKQIGALALERDELRSQLSSAERNAEEMRTGSLKRERARHREEADAARRKVQELRFQLEDIREQLEDSQLENRNLKLQIETDKNTYDIQVSELKSKINQLEEQKMLESTRGQTRNIAKTRLELAWEKERSDMQLLLQESQRLSADLKDRVQGIETDKEKDKQAVRKQMLEMRSSTEKERQDSRRKMTELHSSLLEIRESHAKLRGVYDRMKKEREILLKEREEWRTRLQTAIQLHAKIAELAQDFDKVTTEVSDNSGKPQLQLASEFKESVQKVKDSFVELQKSAAVLKEDERLKRTTSFRRAISAQEVNRPSDPLDRWQNPQRVTDYPLAPPSMIMRPPPRQKTLQRKSLSLDHKLVGGHEQQLKIWESEGESVASTPAGSLLSLGGYGYETDSSLPDSEYRYGGIGQDRRRYRVQTPSGMTTDSEAMMSSREGSLDPGGSAESVPVAVQHQKKTLKDKLKLLRRTKSIDVASGRKEEPSTPNKSVKVEKEMSLRSKISRVLKKPLGRSSDAHKPALPPRGATPDIVPSRPTAEKPLSASRGDLSSKKPKSRDPAESAAKSAGSSNKGRETPV